MVVRLCCILAMATSTPSSVGASNGEPTPSTDIDTLHVAIRTLAGKRYPTEEESQRLQTLLGELESRYPDEPVWLYWQAYQLDQTPNSADVERLLRLCLANSGTCAKATLDEIHANAATLLGAIRLGQGKADEAKSLALQAIELRPSDGKGYRLLVDATFDLHASDQAAEILTQAARGQPDGDPEIREMELSLLVQLGRWDQLAQRVAAILEHDATDSVAHHFRALGLIHDGKGKTADVHHVLAVLNGPSRLISTATSDEWLSRSNPLFAADETPKPSLALAYEYVQRCEARLSRALEQDNQEWAIAKEILQQVMPASPEERLVLTHLRATMELIGGDLQAARDHWESILVDWPNFVPALCRLAQILEIESNPRDRARAKELLSHARRLGPRHPLVREMDQLGLELSLIEGGVTVEGLSVDSPLAGLGIQKGSKILAVDGEDLSALSPLERLRRARAFSGGTLLVQTPAGAEKKLDVSILLFE